MLSYLSSDPPPPSLYLFFSLPSLVDASEALPMMIIIGGAVGGGCVLLICVITLVSLCCRHTGKGELNGQYSQGRSTASFSFFPTSIHVACVPLSLNEPKKRNVFVHLMFPLRPASGYFCALIDKADPSVECQQAKDAPVFPRATSEFR